MNIRKSLPRLLQDFFCVHLIAQRNLSQNTVYAYRDTIVLLLRFAAVRAQRDVAVLEFSHLDRDVVLGFLTHLENGRGNSVRTRNTRLAAIHSFFRYVATEEPACIGLCRAILGIPFKRGVDATFSCLDRMEVEHLLAIPDRTQAVGRRDGALLWFLYNTGARAQEVVDVRIPAVRFSSPAQVRIFGKGRKERLCPLWPETVTLLLDMIRDRGINEESDEPLFLNAARRPLSRFGLRHIVRTYAVRAAATCPSLVTKRISPHTFRHTTALHLLQNGVELNVVRSWLGHASIETTHRYVEINMEMKRAALAAASPPSHQGWRPRWQEPDLLQWLERL